VGAGEIPHERGGRSASVAQNNSAATLLSTSLEDSLAADSIVARHRVRLEGPVLGAATRLAQ